MFVCQIPLNLPCSVTLQPGPEDTGKVEKLSLCLNFELLSSTQASLNSLDPVYPTEDVIVLFLCPQACGVDFEVKAFCAENVEEKIHKR